MGEIDDLMSAAKDALEAARLLMDRGFHPDAVSRAYYAMLYAARAALASRGIPAKTHGGTLQRFGETFVRTGIITADLAKGFAKALEIRERADYSVAVRPGPEEAEAVLRDADRFLAAIRHLLAPE